MLSYLPNSCSDCCDTETLLAKIDAKLAIKIKHRLQMKRYLADKKFCDDEYKKLLYYRRIAERIRFNADYLGTSFDHSLFISKVKILVK